MKLDEKTNAYLSALAQELRRRREAAGLSKNRLAEMAGLSQQMVSYIEKRTNQPSAATLYRLAEALGTTTGSITTAADKAHLEKKVPKTPIPYRAKEDAEPGLVAEEPTGAKPPSRPRAKTVKSGASARRKKA